MADFTKEWIEHLKGQIASRLNIVEDKMDPQTYDQLVTDDFLPGRATERRDR